MQTAVSDHWHFVRRRVVRIAFIRAEKRRILIDTDTCLTFLQYLGGAPEAGLLIWTTLSGILGVCSSIRWRNRVQLNSTDLRLRGETMSELP